MSLFFLKQLGNLSVQFAATIIITSNSKLAICGIKISTIRIVLSSVSLYRSGFSDTFFKTLNTFYNVSN